MKNDKNLDKLANRMMFFKISSMVLFVVYTVTITLLLKDLVSMLYPDLGIVGIDFFTFLSLTLLGFFLFFFSIWGIQMQIAKLLTKKCDPEAYQYVYRKINKGKGYALGNKIVDINANFLLGNFEATKLKCFDALQVEKHLPLRQVSYLILIQIFALTDDVNSLTSVRRGVLNEMAISKDPMKYQGILNFCNAFIDFSNGNYEKINEFYERAKMNQNKSKSDYYLFTYYRALEYIKTNQHELSIPLFQELIEKANKLFVARHAKVALIRMAV